jgi:hypothetical protein
MVKRVLINIDTAPNTSIVSTDRNNPKGRVNTSQMLFPEIISGRFPNHRGLTGLLPITALLFDTVGSVSYIQTAEYRFEFCYIGHASLYKGGGTGMTSRPQAFEKANLAKLSPR